MSNTHRLLDRLTTAEGLRDVASDARRLWQNQSDQTRGLLAGGVIGVLLTGGGRRVLGAGVRLGSAAFLGAVALRLWRDRKQDEGVLSVLALGRQSPLDEATARALSRKLVQAMVAAARADGHVSPDERARIDGALADLGLSLSEQDLILSALETEPDALAIAALAGTPQEAAQIYAATLLVIQQQSPEEKGYLATLAAALGLEADLVAQLHVKAANLA